MNIEEISHKQATDYFNHLKQYRRLFPTTGVPLLLVNTGWWESLTCIIVINCFVCALLLKLCFSEWKDARFYFKSTFVCVGVFDLSYLLTQFLNPGIVYNQMLCADEEGKLKMCPKCLTIREEETSTHCNECEVCVTGIDHHCGWFGKCIAGWNKWFFYIFLMATFALFVDIIVTGTEFIAL